MLILVTSAIFLLVNPIIAAPSFLSDKNGPGIPPHPLFDYKSLSPDGSTHRYLTIPEYYYHNASLASFFLSSPQSQHHPATKKFAPLKTYTEDDGVYAGENHIPYITAPRYRVYKNKDGVPVAHDITLFTQLSLNRFHLIQPLLTSWHASISIALYIESLQDLPLLSKQLRKLDATVPTSQTSRTITLSLLFSPEFLLKLSLSTTSTSTSTPPLHHPYDLLYPINALRNLALLESHTSLVFSIDADFIPSHNLFETVTTTKSVLERLYDLHRPSAIVLAAFEEVSDRSGGLVDDVVDRGWLERECSEGRVFPFHFKVNPVTVWKSVRKGGGRERVREWCTGKSSVMPKGVSATSVQGHTDFTKWFGAEEVYEVRSVGSVVAGLFGGSSGGAGGGEGGKQTKKKDVVAEIDSAREGVGAGEDDGDSADNQKFKVQEKPVVNAYYEPYFIARRAIVPMFDTTFRGYSFNKRSQSIEMQLRGVRMHVAPHVFIVHKWHGESNSRKEWKVDTTVARKTVKRVYRKFLVRMKEQYGEMWRRGGKSRPARHGSKQRAMIQMQ